MTRPASKIEGPPPFPSEPPGGVFKLYLFVKDMAFRFDRSPNELTRSARALLRFPVFRKGVFVMPKPKTHFKQVPVKVAEKIAEKETPAAVPHDQLRKK